MGEETYYIDLLVDAFEERALDEASKAFNQIVFYGKDIEAQNIIEEARQFPLMGEKRLVIVKEAQDMKKIEELEAYVSNPVLHTILVLVLKYKKLDKRTKFAKVIMENGVIFETKPLYENQMPKWIMDYAKSKSIKLNPDLAQMLADYLGTELHKVANEIDKLVIAVGANNTITPDDIQQYIGVSKEYNVFELNKALALKDVVKANLIANYISDHKKENPMQIVLPSISNYFMKLLLASQSGIRSESELYKLLGLANFNFAKEYLTGIKNYPIAHLRKILLKVSETDMKSKGLGNRSLEDNALLKELIYFILHVN
jgi:DNA polymerase-3 subunit delta